MAELMAETDWNETLLWCGIKYCTPSNRIYKRLSIPVASEICFSHSPTIYTVYCWQIFLCGLLKHRGPSREKMFKNNLWERIPLRNVVAQLIQLIWDSAVKKLFNPELLQIQADTEPSGSHRHLKWKQNHLLKSHGWPVLFQNSAVRVVFWRLWFIIHLMLHLHGASWGCPNCKPFDWQPWGGTWHSSPCCTCKEFRRREVEFPLSSLSSSVWPSGWVEVLAKADDLLWICRVSLWWEDTATAIRQSGGKQHLWGQSKSEEGLWGVISWLVGSGVAQYCVTAGQMLQHRSWAGDRTRDRLHTTYIFTVV